MFARPYAAFAGALSIFLLLAASSEAFLKPNFSRIPTRNASTTQVNLFDFFNEGKKALVKSLAGEYDEAAIKARIDGLISENPVFMFSFTTWPFCIKAKELLDGIGAKYTGKFYFVFPFRF